MKKILIMAFTIIFVISCFLTGYRKSCGTWNPFKVPTRLTCFGRTYNKSGIYIPRPNIPSYKPAFKLNSYNLINILTGKKVYSTAPKGEFVPTGIFLKIGNNKYEVYSLSGGP